MSICQVFLTTWDFEPSVIAGCAALLAFYLGALHFRLHKAAWYFIAGVLVLLFALISPVDTIGDTYLFSAHMIQHLLLILVVPPLLLLGLPYWMSARVLRWPVGRAIEAVFGRPLLAWLLSVGTIWIWHLPVLYNGAVRSGPVHILQHILFLVTATIFWWQIIAPPEARRLRMLGSMGYLVFAALASSMLGIILTFAAPGLYAVYLNPYDRYGILGLIRNEWGLSPAADQQLGGLLMWVPGSLVYLGALMATMANWYSQAAREDAAKARREAEIIAVNVSVAQNSTRPKESKPA